MDSLIIGIDLGTTNSVVSVLKEGLPVVIPVDGDKTMPSCVGLAEDGSVRVGKAARNQLVAHPEQTILSVKRKMGTDEIIQLGDKRFTPVDISSLILAKLRDAASQYLQQPVHKAVITVPAYFDEHQREATRKAGEQAGLEVVRIVNEPTAAAMAYSVNSKSNETLLVYDLGGGTFDVSVVTSHDGITEVKASHGDTHLGGDDFDALLIDSVSQAFKVDHGIDLRENLTARTRLKIALERAKCQLSDHPFTTVKEEFITADQHLDIELSRSDFESQIDRYLDKTVDCIRKALDDAHIQASQLDKVILVGGSTRIPAVHRLIEEKTGTLPRGEVDPDLIVAMGAAMLAGSIAGQALKTVLVDITPHTFSTAALGYPDEFGAPQLICRPIIPRNTPIPTRKSEVFYKMHPEQQVINCTVYQGESLIPEENTLVHEFEVNDLSTREDAMEIIVHYDLNLNGMLEVTVVEKTTGKKHSALVNTRKIKPSAISDEVIDIQDYIGQLNQPLKHSSDSAESTPDADFVSFKKRAESLIQQAQETCTELNAEDKQELDDLSAEIHAAIKDQDTESLASLIQSLEDFIFYVND